MIKQHVDPRIIVLDLFAGAGGTTSGFENVPEARVIACVNHDENAIKSHEANHPDAEHYIEDITEMYGLVRHGILFESDQLLHLKRLVNLYKAFYPQAVFVIWASLECTNFSKAKGGQSRDADSRTLANHLDRYIIPLCPEYIMIENVVEFMAWGPLMARVTKTEEGYKCCEFRWMPKLSEFGDVMGYYAEFDMVPNSQRNGTDFLRWKNHICQLGYNNDWKELNAADFGAYTSRNRLFGIFARSGFPIAWPEATHEKVKTAKKSKKSNNLNVSDNAMYATAGGPVLGKNLHKMPELFSNYGKRAPWKPVKDVLDFSDEGKSIFERVKPLSDKTLGRIYAGLIKFVAGGKDAFMAKTYATASNNPGVYSIEDTAHTITTRDGHHIVKPVFLTKNFSGHPDSKNITVDGPCGALTTIDHHALVTAYIHKYHGNGDNLHSVDAPAPTLATKDQIGLMRLEYLVDFHGTGSTKSIEDPSPTITTKDKLGKIHPCFIMRDFSSGGFLSSIESPAGAVMPFPKLNLVTPFIMPTNYENMPTSIDDPIGTIVASRKHHYIVNPSHGGHNTGTDSPCPVVVARQDKAPLYLSIIDQITQKAVGVAIRIDPEDSQIMVMIKIFMVLYDITDIKMRMLKIMELLRIQGFGDNYKLFGTQSQQKKYIGNAVHPVVLKHMALAILHKIDETGPLSLTQAA